MYEKAELEEALRAIKSTLGKCEKVVLKLKENSAQYTLMIRRIDAFRISAELIQRELDRSTD
ncbi:hypothetical protein FA047_01550 [Pedobacter frigoris]|uniref:Uncharacterized protein n=2 Tax=Pedobacter frigoris TaxID=2571272 RepID=A0A4U1CV74_9SPHI|nr:hypothetical protein FA047_01550 [Pedobacter frigoris]